MSNPAVDAPRECMILIENMSLTANQIYLPNDSDHPSGYTVTKTGWFNVGGYDYINGCARSPQSFSVYVQQSFNGSTVGGCVTPHLQETFTSANVTDQSDGVTVFATLEFEVDVRAKYARLVVVNSNNIVTSAFNLVAYRASR